MYTVGENATLTCSSDLSITSTKLLHNFQVVGSSSSSELQTLFNPVNDSLHGNEYTCRSISSYGIQEQTIQIIAQSKIITNYFMLLKFNACFHV